MRVVHLYPFVPRGRHGGTLRLLAAVEAGAALGDTEVHHFDPAAESWAGPLDSEALATRMGEQPDAAPPADSLKRRLFPSTLWESGARPRRALAAYAEGLRLDAESVLVLHTTYLAPALAFLPSARARVVDVYDLVWCAHRNDVASAGPALRAVRRAYAATVRRREEHALARADSLVVAGAGDLAELSGVPPSRWIATPTPVESVRPRTADGAIHVGVLGNFAHISTRRTLELVLGSPLAGDESVRVIVAGLHSESAVAVGDRVEVLGPVERAEDFYARVDCVVAPVDGGSGIKCKLAEAILAGRPVITTELGAAGYPAPLRSWFTVCTPAELRAPLVRAAVASFESEPAREAFESAVGTRAVSESWTATLEAAAAAA